MSYRRAAILVSIRRAGRAALLLSACGTLAIAYTWPLVLRPASTILGSGAGDNVTFLWNFWWMREALRHRQDFFECPAIFAPWGTSLVLHTHTALPAFAGATLLRSLPIVSAQNVVLWAGLAANAAAMFALARDRTHDRLASAIGAFIFGSSPFLTAQLQGHWNVVHLWPLPLTVLFFGRAVRAPGSFAYAAATAAVLLAAFYTDYYITLFAGALILVMAAQRVASVNIIVRRAHAGPATLVLAGIVACAFAGAIWIAVSGGGVVQIGSLTVVARSPTNLSRAGWIGVLFLVAAMWRPRIRWIVSRGQARTAFAACAVVAAIVAAGGSPLFWRAARLAKSGDYVSQQYRWRSAPRGIDLLSLVAGNPQSPIYGRSTRGLYASLKIDPIEGVGWLGITPLLLAMCALRDRRHAAMRWALLLAGAVVWAFGPFLNVAGRDVGLPLPQLFQRFVPILSNARIPGRAMAVAYLALAMLAALGAAAIRARPIPPRRLAWILVAVCVGLLLDYWPAPFPVTVLSAPPLYESLAGRERGTIGELPLGIRDGFGELGQLDHRTIYYQTIHGRPMLGGFVARLSPSLRSRYVETPVIGSLLKLSSGATLSSSDLARDRLVAPRLLREWRLNTFIVRKDASAALRNYLTGTLDAHTTLSDDEREVYVVRR